MGSSTVAEPSRIQVTSIGASISNGTMILWVIAVSGTVPIASPPVTLSPIRTNGVNDHFVEALRPGASTPRGRNVPCPWASTSSGF